MGCTRVQDFYLGYFSPGPFKFTDTLMSKLRMYKEEKNPSKQTIGLDSNYLKSENPNFVVYQVSLAFGISLSLHFSYKVLMILLGSLAVEKITNAVKLDPII